MASDILIVDDEIDIRELIGGILEDEGYTPRMAGDSDSALALIAERRPALIVLDIWLQGSRLDGLEVLEVIKDTHPDLPVVIISGHGNIETAVSAIQLGAYDFIEKPFKADRLIHVVARALEVSKLKREFEELKIKSGGELALIGQSGAMRQLRQQIERVAPTGSRIMISGPAGSGKELAARMLHQCSKRTDAPFIALNAANMSPENVELELFGSEEGPDSAGSVGALEAAHNGTLFIDEVAEMPIETQSKVLRVLVEQSFHRIGGKNLVKVDVRIISSTSKNLDEEITYGRFREDLFHRLSVVPINVPTLAERRDDIPELISYFMSNISASTGLPMREVSPEALAALQSGHWPGNVRQLRNNIERLMILAGDEPGNGITAEMLSTDRNSRSSSAMNGAGGEVLTALPLREAREVFEREYLLAQVNRFGGNISRTAAFVGMERSALHRKLKLLGVSSNNRT
jgi:two-component system, NtrC family, nitrogen regulation response regulator NtrX